MKIGRRFPAISLVMGLLASAAAAGTVNYTGAAGADFEVGGNWGAGSPPADNLTGDTAAFAGTAPNLSKDRSILGLSFTGSPTLGGAWLLHVGAGGAVVSAAWLNPVVNANLSLDADSVWNIVANSSLALGGTLGGSGKMSVSGSGWVVLAGGSGGYTGTVDVTGCLRIDSANALGSGLLQIRNGASVGTKNATVTNAVIFTGGSVTFGVNNAGNTFASSGAVTLNDNTTFNYGSYCGANFSGNIAESGGSRTLTNNTSTGYTLVLSGNNTFSGGIVLNSGTCYANSAGALGTGVLVLNGGTIACSSGTRDITNAVRVDANSGMGVYGAGAVNLKGPVTLTGTRMLSIPSWEDNFISGPIGESVGGCGLTVSGGGSNAKLMISGANSYTGPTVITNVGGATTYLRAGAANVITNVSAVSVCANACFDMNGYDQSVGSIGGDGSVALGSATLTAGWDGRSTTLAGPVSGANGRLIKTGGGAMILNGANTYSGATIVSNGTLLVNGSLAAGPAVTNVAGVFGGTGTVSRAVFISDGAGLAPGSPDIGVLTVNNLTLLAGSMNLFDIGTTNASDKVAANGNLVLAGVFSITNAPGFGPGMYPIVTYTGTLTDNGATVVAPPGYKARLEPDPVARIVWLNMIKRTGFVVFFK